MQSARFLTCGSAVVVLACASVIACGSKTGLLTPQSDSEGSNTGAPLDAAVDALLAFDAGTEFDAAEEDALPPIDVTHPPTGVSNSCPDAAATLVYVITEQYNLMSFYPPTGTFTPIGRIQCPASRVPDGTNNLVPATPFSMAVDQQGIAYVVYNSGELFRVSTATGACRATTFVAGQQGFTPSFGMGYSRDLQGQGESLYVASDDLTGPDGGSAVLPRLGTIDTQSFRLRVVSPFRPPLYAAELTGTGAGDLFAFYSLIPDTGSPVAIGQVDKSTGQLVGQSVLPGIDQGCGWAFAFWGGDFYTFTAPTSVPRTPSNDLCRAERPGTVVNRFSPKDGSIVKVTQIAEQIVGAGVSTCAPQQ
jgi:hypothetical protein